MQRLCAQFPRLAWLNPIPREHWDWTPSIGIVRELIGERMYPLSVAGIGEAIDSLSRAPVGASGRETAQEDDLQPG